VAEWTTLDAAATAASLDRLAALGVIEQTEARS
jgi:hypothetical protein